MSHTVPRSKRCPSPLVLSTMDPGGNVINFSLIHQTCGSRIVRDNVTKWLSALWQLINIHGTIPLYLRIVDLCTSVWFGIARHLGGKSVLGTPFLDRFTRKIFLAEHEVVPRHLAPVAIFTRSQQEEKKPNKQEVYFANKNDEHNSDTDFLFCVHIATRVVYKLNTQ